MRRERYTEVTRTSSRVPSLRRRGARHLQCVRISGHPYGGAGSVSEIAAWSQSTVKWSWHGKSSPVSAYADQRRCIGMLPLPLGSPCLSQQRTATRDFVIGVSRRLATTRAESLRCSAAASHCSLNVKRSTTLPARRKMSSSARKLAARVPPLSVLHDAGATAGAMPKLKWIAAGSAGAGGSASEPRAATA